MKRHAVILVTLMLLCFLLGCTSMSALIRSDVEGVPVWVYEPLVSRNQVSFVGKGTDSSENKALLLSYESILSQLSAYIGSAVTERHISELSSKGSIEAYKLVITQRFVKKEGEKTTVYLLGIADKELLEKERAEANKAFLERQEQLKQFTSQADRAFRENRDLEAASLYLEAAIVAYGMPLQQGASSYTAAIGRVESILRSLQLSVDKGDPSVPTTVVTLRRGGTRFAPRVAEASVCAYATCRNTVGREYEYVQRFVTNKQGEFSYRSDNPGLIAMHVLVFGIDFADELGRLEAVDSIMASQLRTLIEDKRIFYPYQRVSPVEQKGLTIAIIEYSQQGELQTTDDALRRMIATYEKDGIELTNACPHALEDEIECIEAVHRAYPQHAYLMLGKAGISDVAMVTGDWTVTVIGDVSLVDLHTGSVLATSGDITAVASAASQQDARQGAFDRFGSLAASLLYPYLFF